jgi:hypothetical protein
VEACKAATSDVERKCCAKHSKKVTRQAKWDWADSYITSTNIWEVAAWRHGQCQNCIPTLHTEDGTLTYEHDEMANILANWFFAKDRDNIPWSFWDDPPSQEEHPFFPITEVEGWEQLKLTTNSSSPRDSGIG